MITHALVFFLAASAQAQSSVVPPACAVKSVCQTFFVPSVTFPNGSTQSTAAGGGGGPPTGPAGGDLSGTYPNPNIAAGAVTTAKLGASAVDTTKLATDAVTTINIINAAVDTTKLAADAVSTAQILNANVTTAKLASSSVDTTKLATDAVATAQILNANVTTAKLANSAVDTTKLAADAVTTVKILDGNVTNAKLASGSVDTNKIVTDAVTNSKILNAAVDTTKLASDAVTTSKILDGSVTASKLAAGATPTSFVDSTFQVYSATDATKIVKIDASAQATGTKSTLLSNASASKSYYLTDMTSSSGTIVVADGDTGVVVIGTSTRFNGSNSGIQYNTDVANRAQIRVNAYGNHTGVSGMTCTKSRGAFGVDSSVTTGDILCRTTVGAAAATPGSKPNVADASYEAATVNATTMGVNYNLRLMNNAGVLATKFFVTSEGASSIPQGLTASSITLSGDAFVAGNVTSQSSVTASAFFGDGSGLTNISATVAPGSIDTAKLATDAVTTSKILNANVTTAKISALAVDTTKLATDAVGTSQILNASVTNGKIATLAVDTTKIAADAVTTTKILDGNVTTAKLAASSVDTTKIATDAVLTVNILNANVTTAKIAALAVDTSKLATDSVTNAKILNASVDTNKLSTDAVTTVKILDGAVTPAKLQDTSVTPGNYGSATKTLSIIVDADGRLTSASTQTISISTGEALGTSVVQIANGGTAGTTATAARSNLSAAVSGANNDITSMSALSSISSAVTMTSSMTNTSSGGFLATSSMTASGFFGNGSGLTGFTVAVDSQSTSVINITNVQQSVSTGTLTMRGSRTANVQSVIHINNASGGSRDYTLQIYKDGVVLGPSYIQTVTNGNNATVMWFTQDTATTSGSHSYATGVHSSAVNAGQTIDSREISVREF